jgi:hypothetical protein
MTTLLENQQKRKDCIEKYKDFIDGMIIGKQKGIRFRRWFRCYLLNGANVLFETEEEEYEYIDKFGRGAWNEETLRKTFKKTELDIIVELAEEYGAFDY